MRDGENFGISRECVFILVVRSIVNMHGDEVMFAYLGKLRLLFKEPVQGFAPWAPLSSHHEHDIPAGVRRFQECLVNLDGGIGLAEILGAGKFLRLRRWSGRSLLAQGGRRQAADDE